jgi:hypothetical protein
MTTILQLPISSTGAYVRAAIFGMLFLICGFGTVLLAFLTMVLGIPGWIWPLVGAVAAVTGVLALRAMRDLGGTFELVADDAGNYGARLLSKSGMEQCRLDPPLEYVRGVARMNKSRDLVICFAGRDGEYPITIHGKGGDRHQEWLASWGKLDAGVWSRVQTWYGCKRFSEVAHALEADRATP